MRHCESVIVSLFFFSLSISKPGIYVGSALIVIYGVFLAIRNEEFFRFLRSNSILKLSIGLYLFGLISSAIPNLDVHDISFFARKGGYFLILPVLVFIFRQRTSTKKLAFSAFLSGLAIAMAYSFLTLNSLPFEKWLGTRLDSFWDVGRWSEILVISLAFLLPNFNNEDKGLKKYLVLLLTLSVVACLLFSGSRAPWIAASIMIAVYTAIRNKKLFFTITISISLILASLNVISPKSIDPLVTRINTIVDVNSHRSNKSRLLMWEKTVDFSIHNAKNNATVFLFGLGQDSSQDKYRDYLENDRDLPARIKKAGKKFSYSDHHSAILNMLVKQGFLFSILYIFFIMKMLLIAFKNIKNREKSSEQVIMSICSFLFIGIFYSNAMEFQTLILFSLVAISLSNMEFNGEHEN